MRKAESMYANEEDMMPMTVENILHQESAPLPLMSPLGELDDSTLVAAAKDGQNQAFDILVARHRRKIIKVALRFTRPEDAEDVAQQVFHKAFVHLKQFAGHSTFSTWLTRIAINEALMWRRRKNTDVPTESSTEGEPPLPLDFLDPGLTPEEEYARREREQLLFAALKELTPTMRRAIELHKLEELSLRETSRAMRISVLAVKSRVFHGKAMLRKLLKRCFRSTSKQKRQGSRRRCESNHLHYQQLVCDACD
jgi:RNA polymerase sigma-70 factor (ECF subfamily)